MGFNKKRQQEYISTHEIAKMRQSIDLLRSQTKSGRIEMTLIENQFAKMEEFLKRLEGEQNRVKQGERFEVLYQISRLLGSSLDLKEVLNSVMDAVIQLTSAERGFLMMPDKEGILSVVVARNFDAQTLDSDQATYSRTIVNKVFSTNKAFLTTNAAEDPRVADKVSIMTQSLRSIMAVPLRARGDVIGVAYVDSRIMSDLFEQNDLNALETLAGQAAIAIDNAMLFQQTDKQLQSMVFQLQQLSRIDRLLNETLDVHIALETTLEWAVRLSNADGGELGMVANNELEITPKHYYGNTPPNGNPLNQRHAAVQEALRKRNYTITTLSNGDNPQTLLTVPITREATLLGAMLLYRDSLTPFNEDEIDMVLRMTSRAAVSIENAQLYEAVKAADRAKSDFVGTVAHELKVPMTSIQGYANLIHMSGEENKNLVGRQAEFLEKISHTVRRMEMLVSDLADISHIESGNFLMNPINIKVADVVEALKDNTLLQIKERNHQFIEQIEPSLPLIYVDYFRLLQVLTNLMSNAYKYTPNGGTITLSAVRNRSRVCFTVRDTGIGLTPEQIAKLGNKFWRAEDEYTRTQPGSGLGFAITARIVELMGDRIQIQSEPSVGSTFSFCVPIAQVGDPNEDTQPNL